MNVENTARKTQNTLRPPPLGSNLTPLMGDNYTPILVRILAPPLPYFQTTPNPHEWRLAHKKRTINPP